jgi:hypothetical protein
MLKPVLRFLGCAQKAIATSVGYQRLSVQRETHYDSTMAFLPWEVLAQGHVRANQRGMLIYACRVRVTLLAV